MKGGSLRNRLLAAAIISIASALALYWIGLSARFEEHVILRVEEELKAHLIQLAASIQIGTDDSVQLTREVADPRFERPFSGLYWQIDEKSQTALRSPSLWDQTITLPAGPPPPGQTKRFDNVEFYDGALIAVVQHVILGQQGQGRSVLLIAAIDRQTVTRARDNFSNDILLLVGILALFLIIASGAQIFIGLKPLDLLRDRLNVVRSGGAARLEGEYPIEVQSLVNELNGLIDARDRMVKDARARAGDLAHGLKTPLAILAAEGRKLKAQGETQASAEIERQVDLMNRHVERQLARTRARPPGQPLKAHTKLEPAIQRLVKTMRRLPDGEALEWCADIPADIEIDFDPMDFDEVAGNLLDNARKWARERVTVSTLKADDGLRIIFEDDGPGVPEDDLGNIVERGGRADQSTPGTGLGLAIVSDILEIYKGDLRIENAIPSGLRVSVHLPG